MHDLLGVTVTMAVFALLYGTLSLAVMCVWRPLAKVCRRCRASFAAGALFALRVAPFATAAAVTLAITAPSFMLLEPYVSDEPLGIAPFVLGCACVALLVAGCVRALSSYRKTARALDGWLMSATVLNSTADVPVYRTEKQAPGLIVVGVCAPKVIVSQTATASLTDDELRGALRHEIAHVRRHDNLKKLLLRFCIWPGLRDLDIAWCEAAELAADDAAVSTQREALDLASALIKVSRIVAGPPAELATGLVQPPAPSVSARVQRLLAWQACVRDTSADWRYAVAPLLASLFATLMMYNSVLAQMHAFTEWLVR